MGKVYEVESIIGHKKSGTQLQYLIKWKGYSAKEATYEPARNIFDKQLIKNYKTQNHLDTKDRKVRATLSAQKTIKKAAKPAITKSLRLKSTTKKSNTPVVKRQLRKTNKVKQVAIKRTGRSKITQNLKQTKNVKKDNTKQAEEGKIIKSLPNPQKDLNKILAKSRISVIKNVFKEHNHIYYTVQTQNKDIQYLVGSNQLAKSADPDLIVKFFENLIL